MNSDPFLSARRRINRAKHHFHTLETDGRAFWDSKPYEFVADLDSDGLRKTYKCCFIQPLPENLDWLVIEAVEHLRSALDQIAYATAVLSGKIDPKRTHFPIADSAIELERDVIGRGRCKDIPPDILAVFRGFKPYKGGSDPIWTLNKLCNASKHKAITGVGMEGGFSKLDLPKLPAGSIVLENKWDGLKNEIEFFSVSADTEPQDRIDVSFFVAFGEVPIIARKPVIPILDAMGKSVSCVLAATEHRCQELGLIP